jgi:hypothetical protein
MPKQQPSEPGGPNEGGGKTPFGPLLEPEEAKKRADQTVHTLRIKERDGLGPALFGAQPATPLLVQRLDECDEYYYIVPFHRQLAESDVTVETARVLIDAKTGKLLEIGGISEAGHRLPPYILPKSFLKEMDLKRIDVGPVRPCLRLETMGQHPVLVWKLCTESRSRTTPFYLLTVGDTRVYLRVDGKMFPALTSSGHGA